MPKFDERLYSKIRNLAAVSTIISNRMYHIEVVQSKGIPLSKYPCMVYELVSDAPIKELATRSGFRRAVFVFYSLSKSSEQTRALATAIDSISQDATIAEADGFSWIEVEDITDQHEVPFDYDEKAMKSTVTGLLLIYPEDS